MAHDEYPESPRNLSPLDKVKILRAGTWNLRAVQGTVGSLREFQDQSEWHYIEFEPRRPLGIIIHEIDFDSPFLSSGRSEREASLRYRQYLCYWNGWTISLPEYWFEKADSVRSWRGLKSALAAIRKFTFTFKG